MFLSPPYSDISFLLSFLLHDYFIPSFLSSPRIFPFLFLFIDLELLFYCKRIKWKLLKNKFLFFIFYPYSIIYPYILNYPYLKPALPLNWRDFCFYYSELATKFIVYQIPGLFIHIRGYSIICVIHPKFHFILSAGWCFP